MCGRCGAAAIVALFALLPASADAAQLSVNQLFSDGMVLQTNAGYGARPFIYGTAEPGETVTIAGLSRRSARGVPYPAVVDAGGSWRVQLDPYQGFMYFNATISGSVSTNTIEIVDIAYGDVILCSGQSNMNKPLNYVWNGSAEIKAANHPNLRLFRVPEAATPNCGESGLPAGKTCGPQTNFSAQGCAGNPHAHGSQPVRCAWQLCTPRTVSDFSAVCYLTAKEMMRISSHLQKRPIGLIQAAVDGTMVEEWMNHETLHGGSCSVSPTMIKHRESQHWNAMLAPMVGFSVKMTLWYQGEADAVGSPQPISGWLGAGLRS